jgi:hypothetical protein
VTRHRAVQSFRDGRVRFLRLAPRGQRINEVSRRHRSRTYNPARTRYQLPSESLRPHDRTQERISPVTAQPQLPAPCITAPRRCIIKLMNRPATLIASAIIAVALAGCASTGSSSGAPPATSAAAGPSASALAAPPSSGPCLTHACVVTILQESLPGIVARDGSVITKAACFKSTVRHGSADTYTARCDVTYSDQTVWSGYATLLVAEQKVSWQPVSEVQ